MAQQETWNLGDSFINKSADLSLLDEFDLALSSDMELLLLFLLDLFS